MTLSQKFKLSWGFLLCEVKNKGANLLQKDQKILLYSCNLGYKYLLLKILLFLLGVIPGPITIFKQQIDQETVSYSRISSIWNHFFGKEKWALLLFTFSLVFVQRASNQVLAFAKKENIRRLRLLPPYFLPSSSNTQTFLFMALNHGLFKSFTTF